jgi:tetratricopeptide (TPR) repeat protein
VLVAVGGIVAWRPWRARPGARAETIPVVAIVDVDFIGRDTSNSWIAAGLAQMVATKLSRTRDMELIAPERVRQLRDRAQITAGSRIAPERAIDLAGRLGASWAVTATVVDADTALQLNFTIREVPSGSLVRTVSLGARNVLGLADAAATRLLDIAGSARSGPQLAEAETPNVEAYQHYIRYLQALSENGDVAVRELDAAIALDSGFISALRARMNVAYERGERAVQVRLDAAFQRAAYRASDWDRLSIAASDAQRSGNWARAEATARALVERFPRDPRAYQWLTNVYLGQGRWRDAERAALAQLALDSLATTAGRGPCIPCQAYQDLAGVRLGGLGDFAGAERTLRRLLELQPEVGGAWGTLAFALAAQQRYDEAFVIVQRSITLAGGAPAHRGGLARLMLMGRRYDDAEAVIKAMAADTSRAARGGAAELTYLLQRERGQFAASVQTLRGILRDYPERSQLALALAEGLARLGDYTAARRTIEGVSHTIFDATRSFTAPDLTSRAGDAARVFAWHHALLADAIAPDGDTTMLRALADSVEQVGAGSYYGRDHLLHHHIRGLIAAHGKRWGEAEERFRQSHWGAWGWTRSVVEEARAQMAQSRPSDAIATLRRAYAVPLDAMGRYVPRSELDYWMTLAFKSAGQRDSATVYATRVRTAWSAGDARVRAKLAELD